MRLIQVPKYFSYWTKFLSRRNISRLIRVTSLVKNLVSSSYTDLRERWFVYTIITFVCVPKLNQIIKPYCHSFTINHYMWKATNHHNKPYSNTLLARYAAAVSYQNCWFAQVFFPSWELFCSLVHDLTLCSFLESCALLDIMVDKKNH